MNIRNGGLNLLKLLFVTVFGVYVSTAQTTVPSPSPAPTGGPTSIFTTYDGQPIRKGEYTFSVVYKAGTEELDSKLMARKMPYRVILPTKYNTLNETPRYPVIYLLHGLTGNYANWTDKTKLTEYAAKYKFIIVTPEGGDGWYTDSISAPNDKYESYFVKELIPEIDRKYRTVADRDHRVIAGLSMGGYGAIKFGLKYPEMFKLVGSFSGAIDAPLRGQVHKNYRPSIMAVFGEEDSAVRKNNDIFRIVKEASAERSKSFPFIYLSCGTEDVVNFQLNRDFAGLLVEKKIPHEYRELPGGHTWTFWDDQVREFLSVADRMIKK